MNDQDPILFDPRIADWLEGDPNEAPDQALQVVLAAFPAVRQRHGSRLPWRYRTMNGATRFALGAMAIVAVALGGLYLVRSGEGGLIGGPTPTASPTASPSASASALGSPGPIYPGTYVPAFDPGLTFTIDREVQHNCAPGSTCRGSIDVNLPGWLGLEFGQPRIEANVIRVDKVNDPATPGALIDPPADLATWIASRPGVTVDARRDTQVGGLAATQLDIRTGADELSFGPIPGVTDVGLGLGANWTARMFVLPVDGRHVVIILHAEDGSLTELQPLVDSIVWN